MNPANAGTFKGMTIAAATHMGPVHLTVSDLGRSVGYYERAVGLTTLERGGPTARLGAGDRVLLELTEVPGAPPADGHTGLFHFALLLPRRADLACWLIHATREGVGLTGASDHYVSEALYLRDPDHHGIEIYWDRPRERWEGRVAERMGSWRLDLEDLASAVDEPGPFAGLPDGTVMGHVHLRVSDVAATTAFFRDALGMDLMAHLGDQAAFFAAGGYHHHLGTNTWESRGAGQAPEGSATLRHATIVLPDAAERDRTLERLREAGAAIDDAGEDPVVADPSGNRLLLAAGA